MDATGRNAGVMVLAVLWWLAGTALAQSCGTATNDCCDPNPTHLPGCADASCCQLICGYDPYCCSTEWDVFCANEAYRDCDGCGPADQCGISANSCCAASSSGTPFCAVAHCCQTVCNVDPSCCTIAWDQECANQANVSCWECDAPRACGVTPNDCCEPTEFVGPYCSDEACCATVCAVDPSCCDRWWDGLCAYQASYACELCGPPCMGNFFVDDRIDGADLGAFLSMWGQTGDSLADFNHDGLVNGADLGMLLGNWGMCP